MTNLEIICSEAILHGLYSQAEIEEILSQGKVPDLHTFQGWLARSKRVKKGAQGIETRLWRKRKPKVQDSKESDSVSGDNESFYLAKAYLFTLAQVEDIEKSA